MPYQESVQSRITRNLTSAAGSDFNTPLFAAPHMYFKPTVRTRSYVSSLEVTQDTNIPTGSDSYNALQLAFSQTPAPARVVLARQQVDSLTLTPTPIVDVADYTVSIIVTQLSTDTEVASVSTITSDASATAEEIATALFTDMVTTAAVANITVTDETGSIKIIPDSGYGIQIVSLVKLEDTYEATETAPDLLAAITDENNDWYFMSASNHTETFQLAMAAVIEATGGGNTPKMYFTSTADVNSIVAVVDPAIDVIGRLKALAYNRTSIEWHDKADTIFPEMGTVSYNSVYEAGTTTWKFMQVVGVPLSAHPVTGNNLTSAMQGFIGDRNGNWTGLERKVKFFREGVVVGGEFIDTIRGIDFLNDQLEVELLTLLLNQKGKKIPYTTSGLSLITSTVDTVLVRFVESGFLGGYVPATVPDVLNIPFADKVARILQNLKWTGYLAGAVHTIIVDGNVTFEQA